MIELSLQCALHHSVIKDGASVVITAGVPIGTPGSTNLIKVVTVGTKLLSGTGIGSKNVNGHRPYLRRQNCGRLQGQAPKG